MFNLEDKKFYEELFLSAVACLSAMLFAAVGTLTVLHKAHNPQLTIVDLILWSIKSFWLPYLIIILFIVLLVIRQIKHKKGKKSF